jgi:murein DD-endopeptidase MepM/ murein hydrolase activator NlpD
MPLNVLIILILLLCPTASAWADIYRYLNEDGVECYTDSPVSQGAVRIMKDAPKQQGALPRRTTPRHLSSLVGTDRPVSTAQPPAPQTSAGSLSLPVQGRITSHVGPRIDPIDGMLRTHNGVDIAVCEGTPVNPVAPGRVIYSGSRSGYGNLVVVEHADGLITLYAHNSLNLAPTGAEVDQNSIIARTGSTGRSTGPHLHFEAWKDGINMTPTYLPGGSPFPAHAGAAPIGRASSEIRRSVASDGSLVFTNLPLSHP